MAENSMIGRFLHAREAAVRNNDVGLVRECDFHLGRLGYRADAPASVPVAEANAEADAQPRHRASARRSPED